MPQQDQPRLQQGVFEPYQPKPLRASTTQTRCRVRAVVLACCLAHRLAPPSAQVAPPLGQRRVGRRLRVLPGRVPHAQPQHQPRKLLHRGAAPLLLKAGETHGGWAGGRGRGADSRHTHGRALGQRWGRGVTRHTRRTGKVPVSVPGRQPNKTPSGFANFGTLTAWHLWPLMPYLAPPQSLLATSLPLFPPASLLRAAVRPAPRGRPPRRGAGGWRPQHHLQPGMRGARAAAAGAGCGRRDSSRGPAAAAGAALQPGAPAVAQQLRPVAGTLWLRGGVRGGNGRGAGLRARRGAQGGAAGHVLRAAAGAGGAVVRAGGPAHAHAVPVRAVRWPRVRDAVRGWIRAAELVILLKGTSNVCETDGLGGCIHSLC